MCLPLFCLSSFLPHHGLHIALCAADARNIMVGQKLIPAIQGLYPKDKGSLSDLMDEKNVMTAQNRRYGNEFVWILFVVCLKCLWR